MMSENFVILATAKLNDGSVVDVVKDCLHCCTDPRLILVRSSRLITLCKCQSLCILKLCSKKTLIRIYLIETLLNLTELDAQNESSKLHLNLYNILLSCHNISA